MKKNYFLLIGYSNIARKRIINVFLKKKIPFCVASKSFNKKIKGAKKQFLDYEDALNNSGANIAYISLPNSLHFNLAKKALLLGYHVLIDKPMCYKLSQSRELISLAKKNKRLLSEAIFYNYHDQIKKIIHLLKGKDQIKHIKVNFTIPLPPKNSLLMSKKLRGGVIMDMGPYAASIQRIFFNQNITYMSVIFKKNKDNLPTAFKLNIKYNDKKYSGLFKFGGQYINQVDFFTDKQKLSIERVFSPPEDIRLNLRIIKKNKTKTIILKKDNCFENYLFEIINKINNKKYSYYYKQIEKDHLFRNKIEKRYLKTF
jgi:dTDP-3,4-didehydro-2,6-dideoxy-alpha-D-glucose 3-reductase